MSAGPRLTLQDLMRDKVFSLALLLGVTLAEYLKASCELGADLDY